MYSLSDSLRFENWLEKESTRHYIGSSEAWNQMKLRAQQQLQSELFTKLHKELLNSNPILGNQKRFAHGARLFQVPSDVLRFDAFFLAEYTKSLGIDQRLAVFDMFITYILTQDVDEDIEAENKKNEHAKREESCEGSASEKK